MARGQPPKSPIGPVRKQPTVRLWPRRGARRAACSRSSGTEAPLFPAFQFDAAVQPRPAIATALTHLRAAGLSDWQQALWFNTGTGWLDDRRPVDLLDADPTAVVVAAAAVPRAPDVTLPSGTELVRVHHRRFAGDEFSVPRRLPFGPPVVPTLYAARDDATAIAEALFHDVPLGATCRAPRWRGASSPACAPRATSG